MNFELATTLPEVDRIASLVENLIGPELDFMKDNQDLVYLPPEATLQELNGRDVSPSTLPEWQSHILKTQDNKMLVFASITDDSGKNISIHTSRSNLRKGCYEVHFQNGSTVPFKMIVGPSSLYFTRLFGEDEIVPNREELTSLTEMLDLNQFSLIPYRIMTERELSKWLDIHSWLSAEGRVRLNDSRGSTDYRCVIDGDGIPVVETWPFYGLEGNPENMLRPYTVLLGNEILGGIVCQTTSIVHDQGTREIDPLVNFIHHSHNMQRLCDIGQTAGQNSLTNL